MRSLRILIYGLLAAFSSLALFAQAPVRVIFVNGIQNTANDASLSVQALQTALSTPHRHPVGSRSFAVELQYNPIGWGHPQDPEAVWLGQDCMELFLMKLAEEQYIDDLLKLKSPIAIPPIATDLQAATNVAQFAGKLTVMNAGPTRDYVASPYGTLLGDNYIENGGGFPDSNLNQTELCISQLAMTMANATAPIIVIAHSQGNLIANLAYAKAARDMYPRNISSFVKIVNIANTSQVSLHNLDLTHADDKALFAPIVSLTHLPGYYGWSRTVPSVDPVTHATSYSLSVSDFFLDTPTAMGPLSTIQWKDLAEHSIISTYLSTDLCAMSDTRGITFSPASNCLRDFFEDLVWTAAQSLDASAAMPTVQLLTPCLIVGEGQSVTLSATATSQVGNLTDVHWERLDHSEVNFLLPALANTTMSGTTATSSVTFTAPTLTATTTFKIGFFAKDDRGMVRSGVALVQVQHTNLPPTISGTTYYSVTRGDTMTFTLSATDTDGTIASATLTEFNLSNLPLTPNTLAVTGSSAVTWNEPMYIPAGCRNGNHRFQLAVTDNNGAVTTQDITVFVNPLYFVDDFSVVSSLSAMHWWGNEFGTNAYISGGALNLSHTAAVPMRLWSYRFPRGTKFRTYAKLSTGAPVCVYGVYDGLGIMQSSSGLTQNYQVQSWTRDAATGVTTTQFADFNIAPDVYHLFEFLYGADNTMTLYVDGAFIYQRPTSADFDRGAALQFGYGNAVNSSFTSVKWVGVTP